MPGVLSTWKSPHAKAWALKPIGHVTFQKSSILRISYLYRVRDRVWIAVRVRVRARVTVRIRVMVRESVKVGKGTKTENTSHFLGV